MLKRYFILLLASLLLIVTTFNDSVKAQATNFQNLDKETRDFLIKNEQTVSEMEDLDSTQIKNYLEKYRNSSDLIRHTEGTLDFANAFGKRYQNIDIIYIPIIIDGVAESLNYSFFSLSIQNGELADYNEIVILGDDKNYTTDITVYKNGLLLGNKKEQLTKEHFEVNMSLNEDDSKVSTMGIKNWFSKFSDCLASKGIASWAVTSISIACGFSCGTFTPACTACLVGAGLITEGVVTWCIGIASR